MSMTRPPKARLKILQAAERVVKEHGAARLTFDQISKESGVTRGGITYHFPTKDDLLRALVIHDVEHWSRRQSAHRDKLGDQPAAELLSQLRVSTENDPERRRFVGGMLGAVSHDPALLEPVREFLRENQPIDRDMPQCELRNWILRLAADGLFWMETLKCTDLPPGMRERIVDEIESLARSWNGASDDQP